MWKYLRPALAVTALLTVVGANAQLITEKASAKFEPLAWNANVKDNEDGTNTAELYEKWVNYYDDGWKEIDLVPKKDAGGFHVTGAPYEIHAPLKADGIMKFVAKNRYDIAENKIRGDSPLSKERIFTTAQSVNGVQTDEGILYTNAFPAIGASLLLQPETDEMRYLVKWNSKPAACVNDSVILEVPFRQNVDKDVKPMKNNRQEIGVSDELTNGFKFAVNDFRVIETPEAKIWDSNKVKIKSQAVNIMSKFNSAFLYGKKQIPCSFFTGAVFPVYTDDTDTFYPATGAASPVDGFSSYETSAGGTWAAARGGAAGTSVSTADAYVQVTSREVNGEANNFIIGRSFLCFNASAIADDATVSAVTLSGNSDYKVDLDDDGNGNITVVASTQAAANNLVVEDYDQAGTTAFSNAVDISGITANGTAYTAFTFTPAGIAAVSLTTTSCFALREGHDLNNHQIADNVSSGVNFQSADTAGTASDPKLAVTYTTGGSSQGAPMQVILSFFLDSRGYA